MRLAAEKAREKLLKYYNKVTPIYCIVSALDPRINLEYFRNEEWDERYISDWKSKMEEIWENYKPKNTSIVSTKETIDDADAFFSSVYKKKQRIAPRDELEQ
jgi:hypothetical protein